MNELEKLKQERDEYLDGWKRAKADFSNYKKDEFKRIESILKLSNEQLVRDLIVVLDSFDLAITALQSQIKADDMQIDADKNISDNQRLDRRTSAPLERGMYLIRSQLEDVLKRYGLARIAVTEGDQFDPSTQEAVASVESDKPSGSVVEEVERGYTLGEKVIRAARVKVAK